MGLFDGCLLACDIDGTLVDDGYINPRNIEKIEYFVREGGKFCLCTGRSLAAITLILQKVGCVSCSVVVNGSMIYDHNENKVLFEAFLPQKDRAVAEKVYNEVPDVGMEIHSGDKVFTIRRTAETDDHQRYEGLPTEIVDFKTAYGYNWNKAIFLPNSDEENMAVKAVTENTDTDSVFVDTSATLYGKVRKYYEQMPKGMSKFTSLKKLCEILGIENGKLFAIGDYYNDLEMIKNADISATTEESPDDIKQYADFITGKCRDGAVADFIDYLIKAVR